MQEPLARRMLPRVDRREIAAIFAGGALGTLARAALTEAFPHPGASPGPGGTGPGGDRPALGQLARLGGEGLPDDGALAGQPARPGVIGFSPMNRRVVLSKIHSFL